MFNISLENPEVKEILEEIAQVASELSSSRCISLYHINMIVPAFIFWVCYCDQRKNKKHGGFPHFSVEVLKQRYLECECPIERTHWHLSLIHI